MYSYYFSDLCLLLTGIVHMALAGPLIGHQIQPDATTFHSGNDQLSFYVKSLKGQFGEGRTVISATTPVGFHGSTDLRLTDSVFTAVSIQNNVRCLVSGRLTGMAFRQC